MIYEYPDETEPIRQGDIFIGLPRIDFSFQQVILAASDGETLARWEELAERNQPVDIIVPVRPVAAIVATQDCDTLRSRDITLCEIRDFRDVERKSKDTGSARGWKNILTQHSRINQKWFYLPPDDSLGFHEKKGVDFRVTLRVLREDLESFRSFRRARLNPTADEHFRERISEFFRRYPYDEWYALDSDEMVEYKKDYPSTVSFPWQETTDSPSPATD